MKHYVYRHIRLDTNETFYIGIGTTPIWRKKPLKFNSYYSRAFEKSKRSMFWKNIVQHVSYKVEIVYETNNLLDAQEVEIELIKLFGRRDLQTGTLVNHTDGGENCNNCKKHFNISVLQYDLNDNFIKEWEQLKYIEESLGFLKTNIVKCCKGKQNAAYGFKWKYKKDQNKNFNKINNSFYYEIEVYKKSTNELLGIFKTLKEASLYFNKDSKFMSRLLKYKYKKYDLEVKYGKLK